MLNQILDKFGGRKKKIFSDKFRNVVAKETLKKREEGTAGSKKASSGLASWKSAKEELFDEIGPARVRSMNEKRQGEYK